MKSVMKKIIIYSMVGMMQIGLGATVAAASPLYHDGSQRIIQLDDRQRQHDERQRQENERHEKEMRRHNGESEKDWHERQARENERHNNMMNEIAAGIAGIIIGTQLQ